jgi:hypothetical protein
MNAASIVTLALIAQLGSDDFRTREKATMDLYKMGGDAVLQLHVAETSKDKEVSRRASLLLEKYNQMMAPRIIKSLLSKHVPWFSHEGDFGEARTHYLQKAQQKVGYGSPENGWADWREATKMYITDMVLDRKSIAEIRSILTDFQKSETKWLDQNPNYKNEYNPKEEDLPCG